MPRQFNVKKVLVIGSGPIVIGQAAEFDYAGTQACRALKEEGMEVVLVNSNPATIMTDANIADRVYIEPLTPAFVARVIEKERPDSLLPTLGGQVGLNLAVELAEQGILERYGVRLLGTPLATIKKAEDRELFKKTMEELGEPVPESAVVSRLEEATSFAEKIGFPLIIRPAYTLGGTGGGIAHNQEELTAIVSAGLKASLIHQVLLERSLLGWKEIEYEVMRDGADNCITVCNMENLDPVGIHTGDSIVVAPSQTLSDKEYQMLRTSALKIIRALGIEGGCNVQYAMDTQSLQYYVIEVNPRVSRSSALASKATGYPIAKVATKIAVGLRLDEILNAVTGKTYACFEPALDYVVVKIPRWPFDKFVTADRTLGTQMKATGEVMAIDRTFERALLKAIRSLEDGRGELCPPALAAWSEDELNEKLARGTDERLFAMAEALRRGMPVAEVAEKTGIDPFFVEKIHHVVATGQRLATVKLPSVPKAWEAPRVPRETVAPELAEFAALLRQAKEAGLADAEIARYLGAGEKEIARLRKALGITPVYKMVDTCAAEFEAATPYYYSTYDAEDEVATTSRKKVVVLGSGPIRIGQGIEFDYCSVHCVWALREAGLEAIIINNNPETVSTDFDTSDRLYFEPLTPEDVLQIVEKEKPLGVVVQFGGQTAINLAEPLAAAGVPVLGTAVEDIDAAEDREKFDQLLLRLGIPKPPGGAAASMEEAFAIARRIGFPVVVRPSYVLGGRAMEIVYAEEELAEYMMTAVKVSPRHPVLVDKYMAGKEIEVDAISDGEEVLIPGVMEHIERAGVHSGDSIAVYPPISLSLKVLRQVEEYTTQLARALRVKGLLNIQYVVANDQVYVLEVNPRSSRTVPYLSKITGIPMVRLATEVILGRRLRSLGYGAGLKPANGYTAVKVPVFSFAKLHRVDTSLGPEMKSTGEVMGVDESYARALYKGFVAAGVRIPRSGTILATLADKDKAEAIPLLKEFVRLGFRIVATSGTAAALARAGVPVGQVYKIGEGGPHILELIADDRIDMIINTFTKGRHQERDGFKIRRAAVEQNIPCLTSLDTAAAILEVLRNGQVNGDLELVPLQEYARGKGYGKGYKKGYDDAVSV